MISISAFIVSLLGIVSLLWFKLWEIKNGVRLFSEKRDKIDQKTIYFLGHIKNHIPTFGLEIMSRVYNVVVRYFALIVLNLVKIVEQRMISLLEYVRGRREIKKGVTKSDFLKRVSDHKQSLENKSKNAIE